MQSGGTPVAESAVARVSDALGWQRVRPYLMLLRPLPLFLVAAWLLRSSPIRRDVRAEPDLARALVLALADKGLGADAAEVHLLDSPPGAIASRWRTVRALVRAHQGEDPSDIFLATVRLSPEGRVLELTGLYNLSDTSAVDERSLSVQDLRAAWVIAGGGKTYNVKVADLRGEPRPEGPTWSRMARWQNSITNLQETGQRQGVGQRNFRLEPAADHVTLGFDPTGLLIDADGRKIRIPTDGNAAIEGERHVQEQLQEKARPGNFVTWAVDRVRAAPWFGSDRMQLVKAIAFVGLDWIERTMGAVTGDTGAERVKQELGGVEAPVIEYTDPETGWPPAPMEPMLSPPLDGEGKWRPLENDPFILTNPGAPAPFVQSFIRTDPKRAYTQIWVALWDPRQVALHMMSGTIEPKSATGETGPGLIPRKPEVMSRVVGGFNGGFQATHGEFGMMADGVVYLPPKPYGATVAELSNGATAFGTWPDDEKVPDNIVSFRQNMTPTIVDETPNPYKRNWWGGVPPGWTDESRTVRSGLCQTKEGFIGYFYGASIDADHLILAMQKLRCVYGIHLDMNPGHTGLEFYRAAPDGKLPQLNRKLDSAWEAEGKVSGMEGWSFLGRRMLKYMGLMNFPRYIGRESRDFFYLTLRNLLPGENLTPPIKPAEAGEGVWSVKNLPQHGFPAAIATTYLRPEKARSETKVSLVKLNPQALAVGKDDAPADKVVVRVAPDDGDGKTGLWLGGGAFAIAVDSPGKGATRLASGVTDPAPGTIAAIGIDAGGMLVYAEVNTSRDAAKDGAMLRALLDSMGCKAKLYLSKSWTVAIGGERDLSGHPFTLAKGAPKLVRVQVPSVERIFPNTAVTAPSVWYPLQAKRVRYFHKPKPAGSATP
jgi:hypothetical protein